MHRLKADHPYMVTENRYRVIALQPKDAIIMRSIRVIRWRARATTMSAIRAIHVSAMR